MTDDQLPSTHLFQTIVKLFRQKLFGIGKLVHGGAYTNLKFNLLTTGPETVKFHMVGHEGPQLNVNAYIEVWANPRIHPQYPNVVAFSFHNQAFRTEDQTFGRNYCVKCDSEEEAKKLHAYCMLGVASARDFKSESAKERRATTSGARVAARVAARAAIYNTEASLSSSESETEEEENEEEKVAVESEKDTSIEVVQQEGTQTWPTEPLRPNKWKPDKKQPVKRRRDDEKEEEEEGGGNTKEEVDENPPVKRNRIKA